MQQNSKVRISNGNDSGVMSSGSGGGQRNWMFEYERKWKMPDVVTNAGTPISTMGSSERDGSRGGGVVEGWWSFF